MALWLVWSCLGQVLSFGTGCCSQWLSSDMFIPVSCCFAGYLFSICFQTANPLQFSTGKLSICSEVWSLLTVDLFTTSLRGHDEADEATLFLTHIKYVSALLIIIVILFYAWYLSKSKLFSSNFLPHSENGVMMAGQTEERSLPPLDHSRESSRISNIQRPKSEHWPIVGYFIGEIRSVIWWYVDRKKKVTKYCDSQDYMANS